MPIYLPVGGAGPSVPIGIGVKARASGLEPFLPIGTGFTMQWQGADDFDSGGLHPTPTELLVDRDGLWLFDLSMKIRPLPDGSLIDSAIVQLEANPGGIINDAPAQVGDVLLLPSLTYRLPAGTRIRVVGMLQSTTASQAVLQADWRTYFSMTLIGTM